MLALVLGEAASGKSEFAEKLALELSAERYYIATMQVADAESQRRIERHRQMRRGKGFSTLERELDLAGLQIPVTERTAQTERPVALLECASTLLGNELYLPGGAGLQSWQAIWAGVENILRQQVHLVAVSNCVFTEGGAHSPEMGEYLRQLGLLNQKLALKADLVFEVCCGLPICHKGGHIGNL